MPNLAWITSCRQSACGMAYALVAGYLLDAPPGDTPPEHLHDAAPDLSTLFNCGRMVPLDEPRPALARTYLLPGSEVIQYYRAVTGKVVYVARDPRGIMSDIIRGSRARFEMREQRARQLLAGPDEAMQEPDQAHGNWQLHAREWTAPERVHAHFPHLEDVCVIRYEDLMADPGMALRQIVGFLAIPGGVDGDRVRRTVEEWTPAKVFRTEVFEMPPGMRAFRIPPPERDAPRPQPPAAADVEESLEAAYQERIGANAEFAALVRQFGYAA